MGEESSSSATIPKKIPTVEKVQEMIDSNSVIPNIGYWNKTQLENKQCYCPYDLAYGNGIYIVCGNGYDNYSYSTDGLNWVFYNFPGNIEFVLWVNNKFYTFCNYGCGYFSDDGINWTLFDTDLVYRSNHLLKVCYGNGIFAGVLGFSSYTYGYSENGSEWTEINNIGVSDYTNICYGNNMFVMVTKNNSKYSYDGINCSENIKLDDLSAYRRIQFVNDKFIIYRYKNYDTSRQAFYSYDGINWTDFTFNVSSYVKNITYGDGVYIAITNKTSECLFSLDGINWHNFNILEEDTDLLSLNYVNNKFIGFVKDSSSASGKSLITPISIKLQDYIINNYINTNTLLNVDNSVQPPKYSMKPFDCNLSFSDSGTTTREIKFQVGGDDYGRLACGATGNNAGWLEIATADNKNEPIYARQYSGVFTDTEPRTLTLLDGEGNTSIPGNLTVSGSLTIGDNKLINIIYPVGSVFMTTDSTQQPGTLYDGTTWESMTSSISGVYIWKRTA